MDTSLRERGIYVFGRFRLDPMRRSLTREGKPVLLSPRILDTLLYLVENPGRLIEKDELLNAVWAGRFVEEGNLSQTIFVLRKGLRDAGEEETLISTIPGRGYCFVAPVQRDWGSGMPTATASAVPAVSSGPLDTGPKAEPGSRFGESNQNSKPQTGRGAALWSRTAIFAGVAILFAVAASFVIAPRWPTAFVHGWPAAVQAFRPPARSVAVLAFANMSGDPRQEYLADGFSEELINALSRVDALRVADRASAFFFKDHPATVGDIGRKLNVGTVLEGSVRRQGQRLRISAQLIDAVTGYQLWSHSYDRSFGDILKLQTDIAEDVTHSLQVTLQAGDTARMAIGGTKNSAAFDAYLRGSRFMNGRDETSYRAAAAAYTEAARLDPLYAAAHVMRAYALMFVANFQTASERMPVKATLAEAMNSANRAVALAPKWGRAHAAKGALLLTLLDFRGAEHELLTARELAPDDVAVDRPYAYLEACLGHRAAAESAAARVVARYSVEANAYADQAQVLYLDRRYVEALESLRHARDLAAAQSARDQALSAFAYIAMGKPEMARGICAADANWLETACLAVANQKLGRQTEARLYLTKLRGVLGNIGAYQYVEIYAQSGDTRNALAWLNKAYELRDTGLVALKTDPLLDPIRAMPGFKDVERRLNFPA